MDTSNVEKWSPSSNIYDDLRGTNSMCRAKVPSRSTSTISYVNPYQTESPQVKRPVVSLILPTLSTTLPTATIPTSDTVLSVSEASSVVSTEQKKRDLVTNKKCPVVIEENDVSCIWWTIHQIIRLICIALFTCLLAVFAFTLIFYLFDAYWFTQSMSNNSLWWSDQNNTNFTGFDYDMIYTTQTNNYDDNDEY